jgi:uncharacterized protein YecE (DUF72 family)
MDFGKLDNIDAVDFSLPKVENNLDFLPKRIGNLQLYIGATGYYNKEWNGTIYPAKCNPKDYLKYYGESFGTIEHNTTYYKIPTDKDIQKWLTETPADFRFCPKVIQLLSHSKDVGISSSYWISFWEQMHALIEKIGTCFLQLPPHFGIEKIDYLSRMLEKKPTEIPLTIEARHPNIFEKENLNTFCSVLKNHNAGTVITDVAGRRDVAHMRLTSYQVAIRFVGNNLHSTDYERIDKWVEQIENWNKIGLYEVYFFIHQPDIINVGILVDYMISKLKNYKHLDYKMPNKRFDSPKLF